MKNQLLKISIILSGLLFLFVASCSGPQKGAEEEEPEVYMEEIWLIEEHEYHDIPLTSMANTEDTKEAEEQAQADLDAAAEEAEEAEMEAEEELEAEYEAELEEEAYEIATMEAFEEDLLEAEYEVLASTVVVSILVW